MYVVGRMGSVVCALARRLGYRICRCMHTPDRQPAPHNPLPPSNPPIHAQINATQSHLDGSPWKEQFEKKRAAMNHVLKEIVPPVLRKFEGKLGVDDVGAF